MTPKVQTTKEEIDKLDYIKIKNICAKDTSTKCEKARHDTRRKYL